MEIYRTRFCPEQMFEWVHLYLSMCVNTYESLPFAPPHVYLISLALLGGHLELLLWSHWRHGKYHRHQGIDLIINFPPPKKKIPPNPQQLVSVKRIQLPNGQLVNNLATFIWRLRGIASIPTKIAFFLAI